MITAFISCLAPFQPSVIQDLTIGSTNHLRPPTSFLCLEYCSWHCCSSLSCCCCGEEGGLFSDFSPDCPIRPCCLLLFVQWLLSRGVERRGAQPLLCTLEGAWSVVFGCVFRVPLHVQYPAMISMPCHLLTIFKSAQMI